MSKLTMIGWKAKQWLHDHRLISCGNCGHYFCQKDMTYEKAVGKYIPLCPDCHKMIFKPFSKEIENDGKKN